MRRLANAVSAGGLCLVQVFVGDLEHTFGRVLVAADTRDTDGHGHVDCLIEATQWDGRIRNTFP